MLGFEFQFEQNGLTEETTEKFSRGKKETLGSLRSAKSVQRLVVLHIYFGASVTLYMAVISTETHL